MELIPKKIRSIHRLMVFLISAVIFLEKNLTGIFIVDICIEGYMLIASTDTNVTSSFFNFGSSSLSFRSNVWAIETHE